MDSYGFIWIHGQEWAEDKAVVKLAEKLKEEAGKSEVLMCWMDISFLDR